MRSGVSASRRAAVTSAPSPFICKNWDLRFPSLSREITTCHSSFGGECGERIHACQCRPFRPPPEAVAKRSLTKLIRRTLATLAAKTRRQVINGKLRCHRAVSVKSNPGFYTSDAQPLPRRAGRPHSGIGLGEGRSLPRVRHAKHVGW